jgi:hypothetical protein
MSVTPASSGRHPSRRHRPGQHRSRGHHRGRHRSAGIVAGGIGPRASSRAASVPQGSSQVRLQERMNSPLQLRKVRLRGLGGRAVCGVPCACASATRSRGRHVASRRTEIPRIQSAQADFAPFQRRIHSLLVGLAPTLLGRIRTPLVVGLAPTPLGRIRTPLVVGLAPTPLGRIRTPLLVGLAPTPLGRTRAHTPRRGLAPTLLARSHPHSGGDSRHASGHRSRPNYRLTRCACDRGRGVSHLLYSACRSAKGRLKLSRTRCLRSSSRLREMGLVRVGEV